MAETDHYETLQVHEHAEQEVITAAYRRLSRMYHPDVNKSEYAQERMTEINLAYWVLRDPVRRAEYDITRGTPPKREWRSKAREKARDTAQDLSSGLARFGQDWSKPENRYLVVLWWVWVHPWVFTLLGLIMVVVGWMNALGGSPVSTTVTSLSALAMLVGGLFSKIGQDAIGETLIGLGVLALIGGFVFMVVLVPIQVLTIFGGIAITVFGIARQTWHE